MQPASSPSSSDERVFTDESIGLELFWQKHRNRILLGAISLLLIVVLALGIWVNLEIRRSAAASALARATTQEQLHEVSKKFAGSPSAAVAQILAAIRARDEGDLEASTQQFQQFASTNPGSPLRPLARLAIAQNNLAKGDAESALAIFRELGTGTDPFIVPLARLFESRELIHRKEWLEARSLLQSLLSEFPDSIPAQIAKGQLEMLSLVEPPEAPTQGSANSEGTTSGVPPLSPAESLTLDQDAASAEFPTPGSLETSPSATGRDANPTSPTDSPAPNPDKSPSASSSAE